MDALRKRVEFHGKQPRAPVLIQRAFRGLGRRGHAPGQVHVSTIHAGKGLEFQAVVVIGLDEGDFPSYWATTARELQDARRAFYVSLTRAKRRVDLLYSGFRVTQSGHRQMNGRCRFLDDID